MDSPYEKSFTFEEIKNSLLDKSAPFPSQMLYFFSDITREDLRSTGKSLAEGLDRKDGGDCWKTWKTWPVSGHDPLL